MNRLVDIVAITIGGWIGWWLGEQIGMTTALLLSVIGSGAGLYLGRRFIQEYLG